MVLLPWQCCTTCRRFSNPRMRCEQRADKDHGTAQTAAEAKTSPVLHNLANGEDIAAQPVAWPICVTGPEGTLTTPIKLFVAQCREKNDTHHTKHTHTHTHTHTHNKQHTSYNTQHHTHNTQHTTHTHTHTHNTRSFRVPSAFLKLS